MYTNAQAGNWGILVRNSDLSLHLKMGGKFHQNKDNFVHKECGNTAQSRTNMFIDSYKLLFIYNLIYYASSIFMFKESKCDNNKAREVFKLMDREKEREN